MGVQDPEAHRAEVPIPEPTFERVDDRHSAGGFHIEVDGGRDRERGQPVVADHGDGIDPDAL